MPTREVGMLEQILERVIQRCRSAPKSPANRLTSTRLIKSFFKGRFSDVDHLPALTFIVDFTCTMETILPNVPGMGMS
jgi:hypothetical protein